MRVSGKIWKRVAVAALVVVVGTVGVATPANASSRETFADIVCKDYGFGVHEIKYKGWGVEYPASTEIHVDRIVLLNNEWWFTTENEMWTTGTGSWSTPTGTKDASLMSGTFKLIVWVYRVSDETLLGTDSDQCTI